MSWAKIDDRANEHPKLLEAGAAAAWLWVCGLMYCNRQSKKTGRIPKVALPLLYPRLGTREAKKLVQVGLWLDEGKDYVIHEFNSWNPEQRPDLSEVRAAAGRRGGTKSGQSRRSKSGSKLLEQNPKQVASETEAKTEARAQPRARTRTAARGIHPTPPHPDQPENDDPKPDQVDPNTGPPSAVSSFRPRNLAEALQVPLKERAGLVLADEHSAGYFQPQSWPEVVQVAEACGDTRLSDYSRDNGVKAAVALFAAGFTVADVVRAWKSLSKSTWAREQRDAGRRLGMSSLSPEVVRRALEGMPRMSDAAQDVLKRVRSGHG